MTKPMATKINDETSAPGKEAQPDSRDATRFIFQFVSQETGYRSEPFVSDWDELYETLAEMPDDDNPKGNDYILLVAILEGKQTRVPATPLITVDTFLQTQKPEGEQNNG